MLTARYLVKLTILNILALLFVLPLQTLSYVKTVSHLQNPAAHSLAHQDQEEGHEHAHDHGHDESAPSNDLARHKHSPDEPAHSHAKDFWGIFSNATALQTAPEDNAALLDHSSPDRASFFVKSLHSQFSARSLFRPPIRA